MSRASIYDFILDFKSEGNCGRKRKLKGNEEDVVNALFLWFEQKLGQGARLSGRSRSRKPVSLLVLREQIALLQMAGCPDGRPGTTSFLKSMGRSRMRTSDLAPASLLIIQLKINSRI